MPGEQQRRPGFLLAILLPGKRDRKTSQRPGAPASTRRTLSRAELAADGSAGNVTAAANEHDHAGQRELADAVGATGQLGMAAVGQIRWPSSAYASVVR